MTFTGTTGTLNQRPALAFLQCLRKNGNVLFLCMKKKFCHLNAAILRRFYIYRVCNAFHILSQVSPIVVLIYHDGFPTSPNYGSVRSIGTVRDAIRRREISQAAHDSRSWDADFVRAYDAYEEQQRYHTWKTQHSERRRSQSTATDHGTVGDSRGYYQTLGVHPDATIADIQSAFRGWVQERARGKGTRKMENSEKKYLQNGWLLTTFVCQIGLKISPRSVL